MLEEEEEEKEVVEDPWAVLRSRLSPLDTGWGFDEALAAVVSCGSALMFSLRADTDCALYQGACDCLPEARLPGACPRALWVCLGETAPLHQWLYGFRFARDVFALGDPSIGTSLTI